MRGKIRSLDKHQSLGPELGSIVLCRYLDAVLWKDGFASSYDPWAREVVGWLEFQDENEVKVVWERTVTPVVSEHRVLSSGLAIPRKNVLELKRVG